MESHPTVKSASAASLRAFPCNFEEIIKNYELKILNIFFVKKGLHSFRIFLPLK